MNTSPAESEQLEKPKAPMRFTYPSGSRPLEGYTIKRGVGRGGFGEVYFAVSDAGKEVALKLIRRNLEVELRGVTQCLNLKHPNLIALYDIRTDEHDDRWVVMEYVSGESLEDVIARHPQGMPRDLVYKWFEGMASAVAYLHDHGIVHRDLKPANIFIDEGCVKIGDYGLAKFISCSRRSGQTESVGTVHYMAPEIANGRYGREIDAYALGIILYEMLTGHVPFEGESVGEVLMKHLTAEPDLSALEEPFRKVVKAAMAKDPELRINNAAHMRAMLHGAVAPEAAAHAPSAPFAPAGPSPAAAARPAAAGKEATTASYFRAFFHRKPEPILHAALQAWRGMVRELDYQSWTTPGRFAFNIGAILLLIFGFTVWLAVAGVIISAYVGYFVVRLIVQATTEPPSVAPQTVEPTPVAARAHPPQTTPETPASAPASTPAAAANAPAAHHAQQRPWRRRMHPTWREAARQQLRAKSLRDRTSTALGSMLAASVIAPLGALLACLFTMSEFEPDLFLWASLVAILASWAILLLTQSTEARVDEHATLRFALLVVGALVGVAAAGLGSALLVELPAAHNDLIPKPDDTVFTEFFHVRNPELMAAYDRGSVVLPVSMFAAYFAWLFAAVRWWRMAEWTRSTQVSFWATAWCAFIGWATSYFWWFPQPLGAMLAAVIAFTIQFSSPWLPPSRRKEMAQTLVA